MVGHWAPLDGSLARTILGPAADTGRGPMEAHEAPRPTPPLFLLRAALFLNGCNVGKHTVLRIRIYKVTVYSYIGIIHEFLVQN